MSKEKKVGIRYLHTTTDEARSTRFACVVEDEGSGPILIFDTLDAAEKFILTLPIDTSITSHLRVFQHIESRLSGETGVKYFIGGYVECTQTKTSKPKRP
jgi:hypothetical protein